MDGTRHLILEERIRKPAPKKILTCDGGGILGLMSIEILARIETLLRDKLKAEGRNKFVLIDHFDFVCGTNTARLSPRALPAGCP